VIVVVYLVILVVGFFFLIVRPQRRQMAARRALIAAVDIGDEVVTSGGIHGIVRSLGDETLELEIAPAVVVTVARGAIAARLTEPGIGTGGFQQLRSAGFEDDDANHDLPDDDEPDGGRPDAAGGAG
jgi:preprotein translocase subunit YajC